MTRFVVTALVLVSFHCKCDAQGNEPGIKVRSSPLPLKLAPDARIQYLSGHVTHNNTVVVNGVITFGNSDLNQHSFAVIAREPFHMAVVIRLDKAEGGITGVVESKQDEYIVTYKKAGHYFNTTLDTTSMTKNDIKECLGDVGPLVEACDSESRHVTMHADGVVSIVAGQKGVVIDLAPDEMILHNSSFPWGIRCLSADSRRDVVIVACRPGRDESQSWVRYYDIADTSVRWKQSMKSISIQSGLALGTIQAASHRDSSTSDCYLVAGESLTGIHIIALESTDGRVKWTRHIEGVSNHLSTHLAASLGKNVLAVHDNDRSWVGPLSGENVVWEEVPCPFIDSFDDMNRYLLREQGHRVYIWNRSGISDIDLVTYGPEEVPQPEE